MLFQGKRWFCNAAWCAFGLLSGLLLSGADTTQPAINRYTISGFAQGTDYTVTYYAEDSLVNKHSVDSLLAVIDSSMSLYKPYSLISRINDGGRGTYVIDEHFYRVVNRSIAIYKDSKGIFDITVAPIVQLWGFGPQAVQRFPDSSEVKQAMQCVGMDKMRLRRRKLVKREACLRLDLNGIAQGYTVDALAELMERRGIARYVVELGGELRVKGTKPDGTPMRIGIERPAAAEEGGKVTVNNVVELREGAITTAGNYRRFFQEGNKKVSHHINPRTGYPFDTEVISATIYAADAMTADGYDNVIMAMKADEAVKFADMRSDIEVFVIYRDMDGIVRDTMSRGFERLISTY
ncbi:thiamine biosynthesis lipoprotein [Parapedobacter composti]|uniref:FAD:protein FMN transferase n=1 Tax=Parapedobacter composti TaxID=623281 RepID=A0A1I1KU03_9SPHI|nr:FAD:protein FMN transferase [Parapedobacter composti]SFC60940.1 thiamine biosynthesis lipoprotein [Parapedobacter composti]